MHRYCALALILTFLSGCNNWQSGPGTASPGSVATGAQADLLSSSVETIAGRTFMLSLIQFDHSDGSGGTANSTVLSIEGDGLAISFGSSTPPYTLATQTNTISFGGHQLEIGAVPGTYIVNGSSMQLNAAELHIFYDGIYQGIGGYLQ